MESLTAYQNQFQSVLSSLDSQTKGYSILDKFEQQTKLPRSYGVLGFGGVYLFLIFMNIGGIGQLLSNIVGFVIPLYYSLLALNSTFNKDDDTQLLTYWVVFAFLNIVEFWSSAILYWIPSYFMVKTVFLLYLALPQFNGAVIVYQKLLKPLTDKYIVNNQAVEELAHKVQEKLN